MTGKIRLLTLFALLTLACLPSWAQSKKSADPVSLSYFLKYWVSSEKVATNSASGSQLTTQVRQRVLKLGDHLIPVATVTTGEFKSRDGKGTPTDFANLLSKMFGFKTWKKQDRGDYIAYETLVPGESKLFKLFVGKNTKDFKYSLVTIRLAYLNPAYYESELIQREHQLGPKGVAEIEKRSIRPLSPWLLQFWPERAEAQIDLSYLRRLVQGQAGALGSLNVNTYIQTTVNGAELAGAVRTGALGLSGAVGTGAQSLAGAGNNMAAQMGNLANSGNNIATELRSINGNVSKVTDRKWLDRTTAEVTAIGTATGILTSAATHGLLNFGGAAIRKGYYFFMQELEPEVRQQLTEDGQRYWDELEKLSEKAEALDNALTLRIAILSNITNEDPAQMAARFQQEVDTNLYQLDRIKKGLAEAKDQNEYGQCLQALRTTQSRITTIQAVLEVLNKGTGELRNKSELCASFDRFYQQWTGIELELYTARTFLMNHMSSLITAPLRALKKAQTPVAGDGRLENDCKDAIKALESSSQKIQAAHCKCSDEEKSALCDALCYTQQNNEIAKTSCTNTIKRKSERDPITEAAVQSALVAEHSKMLDDAQKKLYEAYCVAEDSDCGGKKGAFNQMRDDMQAHFKTVYDQCKNDSIVKQSQLKGILDKQAAEKARAKAAAQAKADAAAASAQPIASSPPPTEEESPGFFARLFGIKRKQVAANSTGTQYEGAPPPAWSDHF